MIEKGYVLNPSVGVTPSSQSAHLLFLILFVIYVERLKRGWLPTVDKMRDLKA